MSRAHLRSSVTLLALVAWAYSASAAQVDDAQAPARQPSVTTDVVYGHNDGLALALDVHRGQPVFKFTEAEAAQFSPIRFVSAGSAPSLIVHGDADTSVPMDQGETMYAALTKAGRARVIHSNQGCGARVRGRRSRRSRARL